jgi:hypothetical protein
MSNKPKRPPDALLSTEGWKDLAPEEQEQRIDAFLKQLGVVDEHPAVRPPGKNLRTTTRRPTDVE